jgi:hypothetical protein
MSKRINPDFYPKESQEQSDDDMLDSKGSSLDDENGYIPEAILEKRFSQGNMQYRVKWENYPVSESTWENKDNLESVQSLIDEFDKKQEDMVKPTIKKNPYNILSDITIEIPKAVSMGNIKDHHPKRIVRVAKNKMQKLDCEIEWCSDKERKYANSYVKYDTIEKLMPLLITHYFKEGGSICK